MKIVILINPYLDKASEFYQAERLSAEFSALGVACDTKKNVSLAEIGDGILETLSKEYDACVYLDKDKYIPRMLEEKGMRLFNRATAVELCDDKMLTHIALAGHVPMPRTIPAPLCYKEGAKCERIGESLGFPVVVKECFGSFGKQVYLAKDQAELARLSAELKLRPHLYQEFIRESAGRDLRVICVGKEPIAVMERRSKNDFRSNIGLGGMGEPFEPDEEIRRICEKVTLLLGLDYCGIDLLFGEGGYLVCEVNSNAFFGGIERVTGVNVARAYAAYIVSEIAKK